MYYGRRVIGVRFKDIDLTDCIGAKDVRRLSWRYPIASHFDILYSFNVSIASL